MGETLWERIQIGMEEGFDAAIEAVRKITDKAAESIELTRLRREKARLENQVTRKLAMLGNKVFEKLNKDRLNDLSKKLGIEEDIFDIAADDAKMIEIDNRINKELKNKK